MDRTRDVILWGAQNSDPATNPPVGAGANYRRIACDEQGNIFTKIVAGGGDTPVRPLDTFSDAQETWEPDGTKYGLLTWTMLAGFNGARWERARVLSREQATGNLGNGALMTGAPLGFCVSHVPNVDNQATVTFTNPGEGAILVCTGIIARMGVQNGTNLAGTILNLIDGDTGETDYLFRQRMMGGMIGLTAGPQIEGTMPDSLALTGLSIPGTADENMTLEFSGGSVDMLQSVTLMGYVLNFT